MIKPTDADLVAAAADRSYRTYTIEEVAESEDIDEQGNSDYTVTCADRTCFGLSGKYGIVPARGDSVKMWTVQWSFIRGIQINDHLCFFRTEKQQQVKQERESIDREAKKRQAWIDDDGGHKTKYLEEYDKLPAIFQDRINKFRRTNRDFDWEFGPYEMSCCVDAIKMADWVKAQQPTDDEEIKRLLQRIEDEEGMFSMLGLSDGHSGNSFGFVKRLAYEVSNRLRVGCA